MIGSIEPHANPLNLQVKKFTRHNDWPVSHEIRADLWKVLCHSKDFDSNKLLYETQLEELTKSGGELTSLLQHLDRHVVCSADAKTCLSCNGRNSRARPRVIANCGNKACDFENFRLKESGAIALQKLLIVIECIRPEIRYVPVRVP